MNEIQRTDQARQVIERKNGPGKGLGTPHDGRSRLPEYQVWQCMLRRCYEPSSVSFRFYGAVGVRVCRAWQRDFMAFYRDMGPRPTPEHSIDRINHRGHYSKKNCRWVTEVQQQRNRRGNTLLTVNGETHCLAEWAEITGINQGTLKSRYRRGFPPELIIRNILFDPGPRSTTKAML